MRRRHLELSSSTVLVLATALVLGALGAWIFWLRDNHAARAAGPSPGGAARAHGCVFALSPYGYPASFIARRFAFRRHPPLPQPGWHDETNPLAFPVLFHSVFHGYTVVLYRPGVSSETRGLLERWVAANAGSRVSATPAPASAPLALDVAEWGHELRCTTTDGLTPRMLDRLLSLRGT